MANLSVKYLGLTLKSPIIVSSSPLTASADKIALLERHGAGAVVLKSVFEEQVEGESAMLERYSDYPEAADYLHAYVESNYLKGHLDLIAECKRDLSIPVIASINCTTAGRWIEYARSIEKAGADALELNIFLLPTAAAATAAQIEAHYLDIVKQVAGAISIPVSVKLSSRFTNILNVADQIYYRGAKGVVMYNRFFEPDIDIDNLTLTSSDPLSEPSELRNVLRPVALCTAAVSQLDVAVSTGVHSGEDVVKAILAGAKAVEICTAIYKDGVEVIGRMNDFISKWMEKNSFDTVEKFRGIMNFKAAGDDDQEAYQRVQFMRYFPKQ